MASYRRVPRKDGKRVYELSVYRGRDPDTKKLLSPYTKRWYPPDNWTDDRCNKEAVKQAQRFEIECLTQESKPTAKLKNKESDKTVREYVDEYLARMKMINETSTYIQKQQLLESFVNKLGDMPLKELNTQVLEDFYFQMFSAPSRRTGRLLKPSTKTEIYNKISCCLRYGQERGIVPDFKMPNKECLLIKKEDFCTDKTYLSTDDVRHIIKVLDKRPLKVKAFVMFLIDSGCRIGEAIALRWGDVDLNTGKYKIRYSASMITKNGQFRYDAVPKTGKTRTDYLNTACVSVLKELSDSRIETSPDSLVFYGKHQDKPLYWKTAWGWLKTIGKDAGINNLHPHMFRHAVASILLNQGVDVASVAQKLGHSNPITTMHVYAHAMPNDYVKRNAVYSNAVYC